MAVKLLKQDRELLALMAQQDNPRAQVFFVPGQWHDTNSELRTGYRFERYSPAGTGFKRYVKVTASVRRLQEAGLVDYPFTRAPATDTGRNHPSNVERRR